jgi:hypothetical protein
MTEIPCIFVEDLTEEQKRAYIIADNKLTELGEWDEEILKIELGELKELNFDISLTGFELGDIDFNFDFGRDGKEDFSDSGFIDDLLNESFVDLNPNRDIYTVTFVFPIEKKDAINDYIKANGKEYLTEIIIKAVEQCPIAEVR